jgi:predicted nucleic acid-binding protein
MDAGSVTRGRVISDDRATDALRDLRELALVRYPAFGLIDRIWQLRPNLTAYDATFVALAEILECPLITCDAKITSGNHRASVEVFSAAG